MDNGGTKSFRNGFWVGVLIFLVLVIIGLTVGIVVTKNKNDNAPEPEVEVEVVENGEEVISNILENMLPMTVEQAEVYLDEQLEEYAGTNLEFQIKMMKLNVYINGDEPAGAIENAEIIDENKIGDKEKMEYYLALGKAYGEVGDEEKSDYYWGKYFEIYGEIYGGGEGGE